MRMFEAFTEKEKIASVNFFKMIALADQEIDEAELVLINLLILSLQIDINLYDQMKDEEVYDILKDLDHTKSLEVLRIGYSIMSLNYAYTKQEMRYMELLASMHHIKIMDFPNFYESISGTNDLTALDQLVLVALAKHMTLAEKYIKKNKVELLVVLADMMGIPPHIVDMMDVSFDIIIRAMKSMSESSLHRILEELAAIMIVDGQITKETYEMMLPIISALHIDINPILKKATLRLTYNKDYYELLSTSSETN